VGVEWNGPSRFASSVGEGEPFDSLYSLRAGHSTGSTGSTRCARSPQVAALAHQRSLRSLMAGRLAGTPRSEFGPLTLRMLFSREDSCRNNDITPVKETYCAPTRHERVRRGETTDGHRWTRIRVRARARRPLRGAGAARRSARPREPSVRLRPPVRSPRPRPPGLGCQEPLLLENDGHRLGTDGHGQSTSKRMGINHL